MSSHLAGFHLWEVAWELIFTFSSFCSIFHFSFTQGTPITCIIRKQGKKVFLKGQQAKVARMKESKLLNKLNVYNF